MLFGLREGAEPIPGYRLVRPLGRGGSGEVWEAVAPGDMPVALKFIPQDGDLAEPEIRSLDVLRHIRHPHLLDVQFVVIEDRHLIIAMPLCDQSLHDRLRECQEQGLEAIPLPELLGYVDEIARAIDFLNEPRHLAADGSRVGVQHRDVKPHNIFLVGDSARLADFGLAKVVGAVTTEHSCGLSPYYAAPEILMGQVSRWTDQYSFAACYVHLRTGRKVFSGSMHEVMDAHLRKEPNLRALPLDERAVVARALHKDPERRWPDCRQFADALSQAVGPRPARIDPPARPPRPHSTGTTTRAVWAVDDWAMPDPAGTTTPDARTFAPSLVPPKPRRVESCPEPSQVDESPRPGREKAGRSKTLPRVAGISAVATTVAVAWLVVGPARSPVVDHAGPPVAKARPEPPIFFKPAVDPKVTNQPEVDGGKKTSALVSSTFETRCVVCHRPGLASGGVVVLDLGEMVRKGTVVPGQSSTSPLLTRVVRDAANPPCPDHPAYSPEERSAVREWIDSGARPLSEHDRSVSSIAETGEFSWTEYVGRSILADVRKLSTDRRATVRYLSLEPLAASNADEGEFRRLREGLIRTVADLSGSRRTVVPEAVDPASLVYRIDLRGLAWDHSPFQDIPKGATPVNLFDLLLLEYPLGVLPDHSPTFDSLLGEWIEPSGMVRPIPSLRADWFLLAVSTPPLRREILALTGAMPSSTTPSLLMGKALEIGKPIEPIDGLSHASWGEKGETPEFELTTNHPDQRFRPGDHLELSVKNRSGRPIYIEVFGRSSQGEVTPIPDDGTASVILVPAAGKYGLPSCPIGDDPGTERVEVFASFQRFRKARFFKGEEKVVAGRIIHDLDPSLRIGKRSLEFTTVGP